MRSATVSVTFHCRHCIDNPKMVNLFTLLTRTCESPTVRLACSIYNILYTTIHKHTMVYSEGQWTNGVYRFPTNMAALNVHTLMYELCVQIFSIDLIFSMLYILYDRGCSVEAHRYPSHGNASSRAYSNCAFLCLCLYVHSSMLLCANTAEKRRRRAKTNIL